MRKRENKRSINQARTNRRQRILRAAAATFEMERMETRSMLSAGAFGDPSLWTANTFDIGGDDQAQNAIALPNGSVLVAGRTTSNDQSLVALAMYNYDGSVDASFGVNGRVITSLNGEAACRIGVQSDGSIIVAGAATNEFGNTDFALARYSADGVLDTGFGNNGALTADFAGDDDTAAALAIQSDDSIVIGGSAVVEGQSVFALFRYNFDGTIDDTFGNLGRMTTSFPGFDASASALAIDSDGSIVVAGSVIDPITGASQIAMARYDDVGVADPDFGDAGTLIIDLGFADQQITSAAIDPLGLIVLAGSADGDMLAARLSYSGMLDETFGFGGYATVDFAGGDDAAKAVAVDDLGSVLMVGYATIDDRAQIAAARLDPTGFNDWTFGEDGKVTLDFGDADQSANAVALAWDGTITLAGFAGDDFAFAQYTPVLPDEPLMADAGGWYDVEEAEIFELCGDMSTGRIVKWEWDLNYDGVSFDIDAEGEYVEANAIDFGGFGAFTIALRVTDRDGNTSIATADVYITNVAPEPWIEDVESAVRGQAVSFVGSVYDPNETEAVQVMWDFGDGYSTRWTNVTDRDFVLANHTYDAAGTYSVTMYARDTDGDINSTNIDVQVSSYALQTDADNPDQTNLVIGGTERSETIRFMPASRRRVALYVNSRLLGVFKADKVIAYGQDGNDAIIVDAGLSLPAELHGGRGNDVLRGGGSSAILDGGIGRDVMISGNSAGHFSGNSLDTIIRRSKDADDWVRFVKSSKPLFAK